PATENRGTRRQQYDRDPGIDLAAAEERAGTQLERGAGQRLHELSCTVGAGAEEFEGAAAADRQRVAVAVAGDGASRLHDAQGARRDRAAARGPSGQDDPGNALADLQVAGGAGADLAGAAAHDIEIEVVAVDADELENAALADGYRAADRGTRFGGAEAGGGH